MVKTVERDTSKLPRWARQEIGRLTADLDWWKAKTIDPAVGGSAVAFLELRNGGVDTHDVPLADDTVLFKFAGQEIRVGVKTLFSDSPYLEVYVNDGAVVVAPHSTNVVRIEQRRRG